MRFPLEKGVQLVSGAAGVKFGAVLSMYHDIPLDIRYMSHRMDIKKQTLKKVNPLVQAPQVSLEADISCFQLSYESTVWVLLVFGVMGHLLKCDVPT